MKRKYLLIVIIFAMFINITNVNAINYNKQIKEGVKTNNLGKNSYYTWSKTVSSYLQVNSDGTISRIEEYDGKINVETYDKSFKLKSTKKLTKELSYFGGFFSGNKYNFLVFGDNNSKEDDEKEVVRVVKYSKAWKKLGTTSINDCNTTGIFDAGSLRMDEHDGILYIDTAHTMYKSSDGYNHQSNMLFSIDEEKMELKIKRSGIYNINWNGYVSHSFNQFIKFDDEYMYTVDHGDAYPRAISLCKTEAGSTYPEKVFQTFPISGEIGVNYTGVSIGGFELSDKNAIIAGNSIDQNDDSYSQPKNVFLTITPKDGDESNIVWITKYKEKDKITTKTPILVKIDSSKFVLFWEEVKTGANYINVRGVMIDENGKKLSKVISFKGNLSDCQPVIYNNNITWYVTENSNPKFYYVNATSVKEFEKYDVIDISDATVKVSNQTYTGKFIKPKPTVTLNGKKLVLDTDYTLSYTNNINLGTANVKISGKGSYDGTITAEFKINLGKVTSLEVSSSKNKEITIKWNKHKYADGYEVYFSTSKNGTYKKVKTINKKGTITYKKTGLKAGTNYYFKLRAYKKVNGKNVYSGYTSVLECATAPSKVVIKNVKDNKGTIDITWNKLTASNGYEVYYSEKKNGKYTKVTTINKNSTTKYSIKDFKKGKTYYIKLRAYKSNGGVKYYGTYSDIKSVKVK